MKRHHYRASLPGTTKSAKNQPTQNMTRAPEAQALLCDFMLKKADTLGEDDKLFVYHTVSEILKTGGNLQAQRLAGALTAAQSHVSALRLELSLKLSGRKPSACWYQTVLSNEASLLNWVCSAAKKLGRAERAGLGLEFLAHICGEQHA